MFMFQTGRRIPVFLAAGVVIAAFGGIAQVVAETQAQSPLTLKSEGVDLPTGDQTFPGGAQADAINNNCLACHSADMVLNQPALPKAVWDAEVHKMISIYEAPVAAEDVPAIVSYLDSTKGQK
jgi:hypothetical protein